MNTPFQNDALAMLLEVEELLRPPVPEKNVAKATKLLVSIARRARRGEVSNVAMRTMSEVLARRSGAAPPEPASSELKDLLGRLRLAMEADAREPSP